MRLRNDQARPTTLSQKIVPLVCLITATLSLPLGLTGCSEPSTSTTSGSNADKVDPAVQAQRSEEMFVTAADEKRFVTDSPDTKVAFPEAEFVKGRKLIDQLNVAEAEKVLMSKLDDAVKSAAGETKLGQYCARISTAMHMEGKDKEALKYAILAGHIFYKQPTEKRPLPRWFFNVHLHQGLGYKKLRMYPEAEKQLRKAINFASSAPAGQVDWNWHRLCLVELIDTLEHERKTSEVKVVKGELKALLDSHR
ncbi:MAG: hypothetical protein WCT03_17455 [Candidatus Obscuribacterales bacterium]|jgi:hypothetical protein